MNRDISIETIMSLPSWQTCELTKTIPQESLLFNNDINTNILKEGKHGSFVVPHGIGPNQKASRTGTNLTPLKSPCLMW